METVSVNDTVFEKSHTTSAQWINTCIQLIRVPAPVPGHSIFQTTLNN